MHDRDIKENVGKAFRKGELTIKRIDGKEEKEIKNCYICGKEVEDSEEFKKIKNPQKNSPKLLNILFYY